MRTFNTTNIPMTDRIKKLKEELYRKMPEIEVGQSGTYYGKLSADGTTSDSKEKSFGF